MPPNRIDAVEFVRLIGASTACRAVRVGDGDRRWLSGRRE
jgi:hypothetical protein